MHSKGIAHNDLKLSDVCVDVDTWHVRVCDFGLATFYLVGEDSHPGALLTRPPEAASPSTRYARDRTSVGCHISLACLFELCMACCRLFSRVGYDVWALGCIIHQVGTV